MCYYIIVVVVVVTVRVIMLLCMYKPIVAKVIFKMIFMILKCIVKEYKLYTLIGNDRDNIGYTRSSGSPCVNLSIYYLTKTRVYLLNYTIPTKSRSRS